MSGDTAINILGIKDDYSYSHGTFYANGGIGFDGSALNCFNNGVFKTSSSSLAVSSATKTMLCYAVNGSFCEVFTVTAKNNLDAYGKLNMHNWSIVNTSVNRTYS
ncbi:hypothetical protein ACT7C5_29185 [Bacillus pacificus]